MKTSYGTIVIGCGGLGSAAAYWLARRAKEDVLVLEQYELGHMRGASQDHSRIIRLSYRSAEYTRLTPHTFIAWSTLEDESGVKVVQKTGGLVVALKSNPYVIAIPEYMQAMDEMGIPYKRMDGDEVIKRFPQFRFDEEVDCLYQSETGIADAIKGNAAHVGMARHYGATILERTCVLDIHPINGGVEVVTDNGTFVGDKLVLTAGAWTDFLLSKVGLQLNITVTQEQVTYFATPNLKDFAIGRFPVFIWEDSEMPVYGFPIYGEVATKIGIDASGPPVTPDTRTFEPDVRREQQVIAWMERFIPGFVGPILYTKTCLYAMPRDRRFVLDALPGYPRIFTCVGAGHAYKFASLFGKILSELALDGRTAYPIEPFRIDRPAITDPNYPAQFR